MSQLAPRTVFIMFMSLYRHHQLSSKQLHYCFWPYQFTLTLLQWSVIIKIHTDKWWWLRTLKDIYKSNCSWSILICQVYPLCQMIINTSLFKRLKVSNFASFLSSSPMNSFHQSDHHQHHQCHKITNCFHENQSCVNQTWPKNFSIQRWAIENWMEYITKWFLKGMWKLLIDKIRTKHRIHQAKY